MSYGRVPKGDCILEGNPHAEIEPRLRLVTIFNADFRSRATLAVTKNILWSRSNEWVIGVGNGVASCSLMLFVNGPSIRE